MWLHMLMLHVCRYDMCLGCFERALQLADDTNAADVWYNLGHVSPMRSYSMLFPVVCVPVPPIFLATSSSQARKFHCNEGCVAPMALSMPRKAAHLVVGAACRSPLALGTQGLRGSACVLLWLWTQAMQKPSPTWGSWSGARALMRRHARTSGQAGWRDRWAPSKVQYL